MIWFDDDPFGDLRCHRCDRPNAAQVAPEVLARAAPKEYCERYDFRLTGRAHEVASFDCMHREVHWRAEALKWRELAGDLAKVLDTVSKTAKMADPTAVLARYREAASRSATPEPDPDLEHIHDEPAAESAD